MARRRAEGGAGAGRRRSGALRQRCEKRSKYTKTLAEGDGQNELCRYRECVPSVRGSVRAGSVWFWTLIYSIGTKHEGERTEISGLLLQLENYQCMLEQR